MGVVALISWIVTALAGADRAALPPEQHFPVPLIGVHGLLALTTLVLVLLTTLG
jgi:hypothetical protein